MKYVLQVVRGRSTTTTLRLADGVTSLGRHDDCVIRIKSSQVSRRHCELFDVGGKLTVRDLGSSNGTFVNGKRITGQQELKVGDEVTVGAITMRVATLGQPAAPRAAAPAGTGGKPGDTAVVEAVPADTGTGDEFEIEFDEPDSSPGADSIPLAEPGAAAPAARGDGNRKPVPPPAPAAEPASPQRKEDDEIVAQFLMDLDIDDD